MKLINVRSMSTPFALAGKGRTRILTIEKVANGKLADGTVAAVLYDGHYYAGNLRVIPDEYLPVVEDLSEPFNEYYRAERIAVARMEA